MTNASLDSEFYSGRQAIADAEVGMKPARWLAAGCGEHVMYDYCDKIADDTPAKPANNQATRDGRSDD